MAKVKLGSVDGIKFFSFAFNLEPRIFFRAGRWRNGFWFS